MSTRCCSLSVEMGQNCYLLPAPCWEQTRGGVSVAAVAAVLQCDQIRYGISIRWMVTSFRLRAGKNPVELVLVQIRYLNRWDRSVVP